MLILYKHIYKTEQCSRKWRQHVYLSLISQIHSKPVIVGVILGLFCNLAPETEKAKWVKYEKESDTKIRLKWFKVGLVGCRGRLHWLIAYYDGIMNELFPFARRIIS